MDKYLCKDVVVTPFFSPNAHYFYPSLIGNVFANQGYTDHFKFNMVYSKRCGPVKPEVTVDAPAFFAGYLFSAYGHFILESLSRLWALKRCSSERTIWFAYNSVARRDLEQYQKEILAALGVRNGIRFIDRATLFRDCIVPPAGTAIDSFFIKEQEEALAYHACDMIRGKKTFLSRSLFARNRGCRNECVIDTVLHKHGWNVVYPEKMSFAEQIGEIASSEIVFCISGSALHSIVFLKKPRQKFIVVPRVHGQTYNMIAHMKSEDYFLLNVEKRMLDKGERDAEDTFEIDIEQLMQILLLSRDFDDLRPIDGYLERPPEPEGKWRQLPAEYLGHDTRPVRHDTLFYLALYHAGSRPELSVRAIRFLLQRQCIQGYMFRRLHEIASALDPSLDLELGRYRARFFPDFGANELNYRPRKQPQA